MGMRKKMFCLAVVAASAVMAGCALAPVDSDGGLADSFYCHECRDGGERMARTQRTATGRGRDMANGERHSHDAEIWYNVFQKKGAKT